MRRLFCLLLVATLGGCGAEQEAKLALVQESSGIYWMANQCLMLQTDSGAVAKDGDVFFLTHQPQQIEPFFFKPSALGEYLLFDSTSRWLTDNDVVTVVDVDHLDNRARWQAELLDDNRFRFRNRDTDKWLSAHGNQLILSNDDVEAEAFRLLPSQGCATFPEASTNSEGAPARSHFDDGAVWGMADVHNHLFGSMAFAGNVMAGDVFHPLGITRALQDCRAEHGEQGRMDITGFVTGGPGSELDQLTRIPFYYLMGRPFHDTRGYPDFPYWPNAQTKTHGMAYYKWLERAYLGGLRLVVNLMVESPPLCQIGRSISRWYGPQDEMYIYDPDVICTGEVTAEQQRQATFALQDYIDAQSGGPGEGWFRVVTTPEQARAVIAEKKLAVILGLELPDLFNCIEGVETGRAECSAEYISQRLDEYEQQGYRTVFPIHHYDNDFGGANVFNPIVEIGGVVQTGKLFKYEPCDDNGYDPLLAVKIPQAYYNLFPSVLEGLSLFPFVPQAEQYCNAKSITPLGEQLIQELMNRGMIIETNHMSPIMKQRVLEMAEMADYPLVDTHQSKSWSGASLDFESRYLSLGGVVSPMPSMSSSQPEYAGMVKTCANNTSQDLAIHISALTDTRSRLGIDPGVVISTDIHGMVSQSQPRFGEQAQCDQLQIAGVEYPFTSRDGSITFQQQATGNRVFDFNTDGLAHYGLLPDLVEDMRRQGMPEQALEQLFRGAESYITAWEKARRYRDRLSAE